MMGHMTNTTNACRYRIDTTMGAGWQFFCEVDTAEDAADRVAVARRDGYRSRITDRRGEVLHVTYDRAGRAMLVTVPA